jgi:hypothetical protein
MTFHSKNRIRTLRFSSQWPRRSAIAFAFHSLRCFTGLNALHLAGPLLPAADFLKTGVSTQLHTLRVRLSLGSPEELGAVFVSFGELKSLHTLNVDLAWRSENERTWRSPEVQRWLLPNLQTLKITAVEKLLGIVAYGTCPCLRKLALVVALGEQTRSMIRPICKFLLQARRPTELLETTNVLDIHTLSVAVTSPFRIQHMRVETVDEAIQVLTCQPPSGLTDLSFRSSPPLPLGRGYVHVTDGQLLTLWNLLPPDVTLIITEDIPGRSYHRTEAQLLGISRPDRLLFNTKADRQDADGFPRLKLKL